MDAAVTASGGGGDSVGELILRAAALVPWTHYALAALALAAALLYRFLELHLLGDLVRGLRGGRIVLTFHPESRVYHRVASKCRSLHGRYLATPWLASPHLQTLFLSISGRPPSFTYRRQLYTVRDGGTIALDWLLASELEEDLREVVNVLHQRYPKAPLFTIGTSIGANILVKYLGEEGESTPIAGAASICSPWDLLITNRFISRKLVQQCYDRALAIGLKGYAKLALDDPLCTREAIPWDECRANKNIVLATTPNGGHLAFFEGLSAGRLWWVRAASQFLCALHDSPCMHRQKVAQEHGLHTSLESSIDKSPYVNFMEDGMVAAVTKDGHDNENTGEIQNEHDSVENRNSSQGNVVLDTGHEGSQEQQELDVNKIRDVIAPAKRSLNQLIRSQGRSVWLLAYIAIVTSWPFLRTLGFFLFRKRFRNFVAAKKL
ncbi:hypothetical protein PR202_ga04771 [Eleusine coracana subsp. coracana]|uniref:AB hydrolase-1 domain-containing protein n=1 Tax=Eleusine coracana subsp. coracana TaxID=191504 RepID=A0AAV5BQR0_ELECO|nr:hypothetical protein PR202_ga04771 [Eleusine coracana subsp. coracana]